MGDTALIISGDEVFTVTHFSNKDTFQGNPTYIPILKEKLSYLPFIK